MRIRLWVGAGAFLAAAGVVGWAVTRAPAAEPTAAPQVRTTTVPVVRGDVTAHVPLAGVLGFDGTFPIAGTPLLVQSKSGPFASAVEACRQFWDKGIDPS